MSRDKKYFLSITIITAMVLMSASAAFCGEKAHEQVDIKIKSRANVSGKYLQIKDIAEVASGDTDLAKYVGNIYIGRAPESGEVEIARGWVEKRLEQSSVKLGQVNIGGAQIVVVVAANSEGSYEAERTANTKKQTAHKDSGVRSRLARPVEPADANEGDKLDGTVAITEHVIKDIILEYLSKEYIKTDPENIDIALAEPLKWTAWNGAPLRRVAELVPEKVMAGSGKDVIKIRFKIKSFEGKHFRESIKVQAKYIGKALVARRSVKRGEFLKSWDVQLSDVEIPIAGCKGALGSMEASLGRRALVAIRKDDVIYESDLDNPATVNLGDTITVWTDINGYKLSSIAIAMQAGNIGDLIQVQNARTRRMWESPVRVVDKGQAELIIKETAEKSPEVNIQTKDDRRENNRHRKAPRARKNEIKKSRKPALNDDEYEADREPAQKTKVRAERQTREISDRDRYYGPANKIANPDSRAWREKTRYGWAGKENGR